MPLKTREDRAAYARAWRAKNPDKSRALDKRKRERNPQAQVERMRVWRERQRKERPEEFAEATRRQNVEWRKRNRERRLAYERQYRKDNIVRLRAQNARWHREARAKDPLLQRRKALWRLYKVSLEDYDRMALEQGGVCASCKKPPDDGGVLHVDHSHTTGKVRGLLCTKCNTALGLFGDDPAVIRRAIAYIKGEPLPPL